MSLDVGTCEWLAGEIDQNHLLPRDEFEPILKAFQAENPYADATALAEYLVRRGDLTTFQATRLLESAGRGLILGPYVLVDAVGVGSMGTVYKAIGKADRKEYALKVLPARGPWNIRQARRRLASFPADAHAGVIPFVDVGTSAGLHYLVWPYVIGETLEALVKRDGVLPPARAALIGLQIAQALKFCEQHRVYHGLLKPSNILIAPDGQTKLLDFGVGPLLADAESSESLVDTLSESATALNMLDCLSPEAIVEPSHRSVRADQYSLGCTLYYGLTGRYPFPDGNAFEKMAAHQTAQATPIGELNPAVPPPLARVIERLMQKSPELRYNNCDDLIEALHGLARQSTVYLPPQLAPTPFVAPRGPTTTPLRTSSTLLSAVTPRTAPAPPSAVEVTPPPSRPRLPTPPPPPVTPRPEHAQTPKLTFWQQLKESLLFWKPIHDQVGCTLLTPSSVLPGESVGLQAVIHSAARTAQAQTLPDWRGSAALARAIKRGSSVDVHIAVQEITMTKPVQHVKWSGFSAAAIFNLRVPEGWPAGMPLQGTLTISVDQTLLGALDFSVPIGAPTSTVQL
jgi:serine/threonine protein kinase